MKIHRQLLEPRADAAVLLEPAHALFHHASALVRRAIKLHLRIVTRLLVVLVRNHRLDQPLLEPIPRRLRAVAFVSRDLPGLVPAPASFAPAADPQGQRLADHRFGHRRFMHLARRDLDGQRSSRTVIDVMEFRPNPAARAAQCVVRRFVRVEGKTFLSAPAAAREARTTAPSTHQSSQSIFPPASSLTCNASIIWANTPALRHLEKYPWTVLHEPKRSGRSRQGAPVPRIQKMPSSISRGSLGGRPVRALRRRISGETSSHCSSVSSCRFIK